MTKRQLVLLFVCNTVTWTMGNGLLPLLPINAQNLGMKPLMIGFYMSLCFVAIALSSLVSGWLSDKLRRRKILLIICGILCYLSLVLMSQSNNIYWLAMGTYGVWFCGGAILTLINTIAGLFANAVQRGRIFGILGTSAPIGSLIGGTSFGAVADLAGFKTLFFSVALMIGIVPLLSFFLEDKREEQKGGNRIGLRPPKCNSKLSKSYQLLCLAALINSISVFVARMAVPIEMSRLGFSATKISMITGIGGLLTIPIALLIGLLGDNYPKKNLLVLSYFGATVASIGLALSAVYWHFLVLVCLSTICVAIGVVIGPSLVTEITTQNILGTAMAIFSANVWGGAVIGFIFTGFGLQAIGVANTFIAATFIALLGVFVLLIMKHPQKPKLNSKITK